VKSLVYDDAIGLKDCSR